MKITSKKLKRIIKEEHRRLQREAGGDLVDSLFQILDQELPGLGVDRSSPEGAESVAAALEAIAGEVRSEAGQELAERRRRR